MRNALSISRKTFQLKKPFRISRGAKTAIEALHVRIERDGIIGRGEGIPYPRYGESFEQCAQLIETVRGHIEAGISRAELVSVMPAGAARNGVDCALWDLEAKIQCTTVAALLNLTQPPSVETAITIGLDTPGAMGLAAANFCGAKTIKVKVDANHPLACIRAVRAAAPHSRLIIDPNESWTIADLLAYSHEMKDLGVALLEQPLAAGADDALVEYHGGIAIAADEAVHGLETLDRVASLYDVINIKLDKTGGLTTALVLAEAARSKGLGLMMGCMVCSSLSIAPAAHLGVGFQFIDLDGPIDLISDVTSGVSICQTGVLSFDGKDQLWGGL